MNISEVLGVDGDHINVQDIFHFVRTGVTDTGKVQGRFSCATKSPKILDRLRITGIKFDPAMFEEVVEVNL